MKCYFKTETKNILILCDYQLWWTVVQFSSVSWIDYSVSIYNSFWDSRQTWCEWSVLLRSCLIQLLVRVVIVTWQLCWLIDTVSQEWQCKSQNWDVERCSLQQQIDSLQTQNQILVNKCDVVAKTSLDLRSQLECRREKLEETEQGLKAQVVQLSTLLERSKDTVSSQVKTCCSLP